MNTQTSTPEIVPPMPDYAIDKLPSRPPVIDPDKMLALYKVVEFKLPSAGSRILQFIGTQQGEGTSTIAREFALAAALRVGKSVLLLDANRFKPSQHKFFQIESGPGWLDALEHDTEMDSSFHEISKSMLYVAPAFRTDKLQEEIFNSNKLYKLWTTLRQKFAFVVIDTAPLELSSDGLAIAPTVDGVVMVVEAESTKSTAAKKGRDVLERVGANLIGAVLNKSHKYIS